MATYLYMVKVLIETLRFNNRKQNGWRTLLRKSICALDHTLYVDGNTYVVPGVSSTNQR